MKRVKYYILFIGLLFTFTKVNAEGCDLETKTALRSYASNVSVSYVPKEETVSNEDGEYNKYYLDIKIYNLDNTLSIEMIDTITNQSVTFDYNDIGIDGSITIREDDPIELRNLVFNIYGKNVECLSTLLRTIKLTLPKYNYFSERGICEDIPEYYLCQRYVTYDIDADTFLDNVEKYREKLDKKEEKGSNENNTSAVNKAINKVTKYRYIIAGVIIVAGVITTIYVIKKRRSKII